jgi:hypothetical protein
VFSSRSVGFWLFLSLFWYCISIGGIVSYYTAPFHPMTSPMQAVLVDTSSIISNSLLANRSTAAATAGNIASADEEDEEEDTESLFGLLSASLEEVATSMSSGEYYDCLRWCAPHCVQRWVCPPVRIGLKLGVL